MKLLDTGVLIDLDRGQAEERVHKLEKEGKHAISLVTDTEMRLGVEKKYRKGSEKYRKAIDKLERLLSRFKVFKLDKSVSSHAASIISELGPGGEKVNDLHDIYIAATARKEGIPVLTPNTQHFEPVEGVEVQDWERY